jgi:hypothetical protein
MRAGDAVRRGKRSGWDPLLAPRQRWCRSGSLPPRFSSSGSVTGRARQFTRTGRSSREAKSSTASNELRPGASDRDVLQRQGHSCQIASTVDERRGFHFKARPLFEGIDPFRFGMTPEGGGDLGDADQMRSDCQSPFQLVAKRRDLHALPFRFGHTHASAADFYHKRRQSGTQLIAGICVPISGRTPHIFDTALPS